MRNQGLHPKNWLQYRGILALEYARLISKSPLQFSAEFQNELKHHFKEREIVILAGTAAQVNYWGRLIQALGIPPAGFSNTCPVSDIP